VGIAFYVEDFDSFIRGAGCEAAAVVIEDCVVLEGGVSCVDVKRCRMRKKTEGIGSRLTIMSS
jgi:hypothetical protein